MSRLWEFKGSVIGYRPVGHWCFVTEFPCKMGWWRSHQLAVWLNGLRRQNNSLMVSWELKSVYFLWIDNSTIPSPTAAFSAFPIFKSKAPFPVNTATPVIAITPSCLDQKPWVDRYVVQMCRSVIYWTWVIINIEKWWFWIHSCSQSPSRASVLQPDTVSLKYRYSPSLTFSFLPPSPGLKKMLAAIEPG